MIAAINLAVFNTKENILLMTVTLRIVFIPIFSHNISH